MYNDYVLSEKQEWWATKLTKKKYLFIKVLFDKNYIMTISEI